MFLVNGKQFLGNGYPSINKFRISCGFLKYALKYLDHSQEFLGKLLYVFHDIPTRNKNVHL